MKIIYKIPVILAVITVVLAVLVSIDYDQYVITQTINAIRGYEPNFSEEELLEILGRFNEVNSFLETHPDSHHTVVLKVGHQQVLYSTSTDTGQATLVAAIFGEKVRFTHICEDHDKPPMIQSSPSIFDIEDSNCGGKNEN